MININKVDFMSPPITLFHLERRTHTSKVGGFFVLLMLFLCISYILFLFYDLAAHKRITLLFHKKFEFEAGYYSFNSSSIFHFIQIFSPEDGGYFDKYETKYIRAYTTYVHSNFSYANLDLYDHWVFDTCRKGIDDKDLEPYLFENIENFTNGVCIRYYFNSTEKKYYNLGDSEFSWPYLQHGISQKNNIYLTTIVQKCSNDSIINQIFGQCPPQKDIDDYIKKYFGIYLYFTDMQVDPYNYKNPVQKYFQVISTGIGNSNNFVESYLHFSPLRVRTELGSIVRNSYDINSFYFDFNRKGSSSNNEKYFTITKYYHLMQNNVQIYERKYNNIFDVFSKIGGVVQFIFYLFYWVNFTYNKYVIAYDTNSLLFSLRKENNLKTGIDINIKKKVLSDFNKKDIEKIKYITDKNMKINNYSKKNIHGSEGAINDGKLKIRDELLNQLDNPFKSKNKFFTLYNSNNFLLLGNDSFLIEKVNSPNNNTFEPYKSHKNNKKKPNTNKKSYDDDVINKLYLSKKSVSKITHKKRKSVKIADNKIKSMKYFSCFDYLKALLFKKEKESYNFIRLFRKHLLSEEHLLKSHIKLIFLEKQHKINDEEDINLSECFNEL